MSNSIVPAGQSGIEEQRQALEKLPAPVPGEIIEAGFESQSGFELILRQAKWLNQSSLIPEQFRGPANMGNTIIALELSARMKASPLAVMQNIYIVHGRPSWSAQFIISAINSTGKFSPLRFDVAGAGDDRSCIAWAVEKTTGERLEGPAVTIRMSKEEGWYAKNGSKWKTMPELMLRYRAATFFGRLYAPEILMGMKADDEIIDYIDEPARPVCQPKSVAEPTGKITKEQIARMIAKLNCSEWNRADLDAAAKEAGFASLEDVTMDKFEEICNWIDSNPKARS